MGICLNEVIVQKVLRLGFLSFFMVLLVDVKQRASYTWLLTAMEKETFHLA